MKLPRRQFLRLAAGAATLIILILSASMFGNGASSQTIQTTKIVVPFPPGGAPDVLTRLLAEQLSRAHRMTMIIENRPGAGTMIATEAVSRAIPDGSTVLVVGNSFVINSSLKKLAYDPLTSFEPICLLTRSPNVVVVNSASPYRSLTDFLNDARVYPGKLTLAFQGPATSAHIGSEKLKRAANVEMINVPFLGAAPALNALLGEHVTALFANYPSVAEQVKAGKARVLATASRARPASLAAIPTIAEIIHEDFEEEPWIGAVVPAKTPKGTISQLVDRFRGAMLDPEMKQRLDAQGFDPDGTCDAEFATYLRKQSDEYGRIIREANIKAE
jgi:tripartite-type tricarboxylate transporter receptor subunit TctC